MLLATFMNTSHELPTRFLGFAFVILVGALPAAAQQPTAKLTALADARTSDVYQPLDQAPQPTLGPRFTSPVREDRRTFLWFSAAVYTAALLDMSETSSKLPNFREYDPLARPLLKLPTPLYFGTGVALATGINLAGWKMERSSRWRREWWIAQTVSIIGNLGGYAYTKAH